MACFEHHTHQRKFTKKIKNNTISSDGSGVRYVGDGSWGVPEGMCVHPRTPAPSLNFCEDVSIAPMPSHIWKVTLTKKLNNNYEIRYAALTINNTEVFVQVDQLEQLPNNE